MRVSLKELQRYNKPMFSKHTKFFLISAFLVLGGPTLVSAQTAGASNQPVQGSQSSPEGFAKPYEYERQAYGYDPEGVEYNENQTEDFQVVFITSMPFTALASFCLTGVVSLAARNNFSVNGDYFWPFLAGVVGGSTTIACVSVLTNRYPPPSSQYYVQESPNKPMLACQIPLVTARF